MKASEDSDSELMLGMNSLSDSDGETPKKRGRGRLKKLRSSRLKKNSKKGQKG